jgi:hypothetical protein
MRDVDILAEWIERMLALESEADPQIGDAFSGLLTGLAEASAPDEALDAVGLFQDELAYLRNDKPSPVQTKIDEFLLELDHRVDLMKDVK